MPPVRIAYIAPFQVDYGTEFHLAHDAEAIGCKVTRVREHAIKQSDLMGNPDLILYTKGRGLPEGAEWGFRIMEDGGAKTASFHLDLYRGLDREREVGVDPFWTTGTVFTADGGSQDFFAERGVNHHWLLGACVSSECYRGVTRPDLVSDVAFVGKTQGYHAEYPWREELVRILRARYGQRFRVWGHGDDMRGPRLNDLYASAKVIVGDSLMLGGHTHYTSDRIFEVLGRGGVLVWPRMDWLAELGFEEYEHLRYFTPQDPDSLIATIEDVLADPWAARQMAERGQRFVREHHCYTHRVRQMLEVLGLWTA